MGELWDQLPTLVAGAERPQAPSSFGALVERQARGGGGPGSAAPPPSTPLSLPCLLPFALGGRTPAAPGPAQPGGQREGAR